MMIGRTSAAFTFAEVMIAVLVVTIGILPIFIVFTKGSEGTTMTRDEIVAHLLACELIDLGTAKSYDGLQIGDHSSESLGGSNADSKFQRNLKVDEIIPSGGWRNWPLSYKVLTARVQWESSGVPRTFVLTSLIYRGKL